MKRISQALQKLCEEQERRIEWLMNQPDNVLKSQCLSLQDKVEEQRVEIERLRNDVESMIGLQITTKAERDRAESQLATQTERVRRLEKALRFYANNSLWQRPGEMTGHVAQEALNQKELK